MKKNEVVEFLVEALKEYHEIFPYFKRGKKYLAFTIVRRSMVAQEVAEIISSFRDNVPNFEDEIAVTRLFDGSIFDSENGESFVYFQNIEWINHWTEEED